jgi:hypothetical protein
MLSVSHAECAFSVARSESEDNNPQHFFWNAFVTNTYWGKYCFLSFYGLSMPKAHFCTRARAVISTPTRQDAAADTHAAYFHTHAHNTRTHMHTC